MTSRSYTRRVPSDEAEAVYAARMAKAVRIANAMRERFTPALTSVDVAFLLDPDAPLAQSRLIRQRIELEAGVNSASESTWTLVAVLLAYAERGQADVPPPRLERTLSVLPSRRDRG